MAIVNGYVKLPEGTIASMKVDHESWGNLVFFFTCFHGFCRSMSVDYRLQGIVKCGWLMLASIMENLPSVLVFSKRFVLF